MNTFRRAHPRGSPKNRTTVQSGGDGTDRARDTLQVDVATRGQAQSLAAGRGHDLEVYNSGRVLIGAAREPAARRPAAGDQRRLSADRPRSPLTPPPSTAGGATKRTTVTELVSRDLAALATTAGAELEGATPQDILRWALDEFHPRLVIASSMADAVLVHMASEIRTDVPVFFLDTGYHFAETLATRDRVSVTYPVQLLSVRPDQTISEQDLAYGENLFERDPDMCCHLRKVRPLEETLANYDAWATGLRRDESFTRMDARPVEWDADRGKVKVNPLVAWTEDDVTRYIKANDVPVNPLARRGFRSIGCAPCTRAVADWEDPRAGRWDGFGKTECGLHQ
jgi:phosphoadenosine phosphosulfate reductase